VSHYMDDETRCPCNSIDGKCIYCGKPSPEPDAEKLARLADQIAEAVTVTTYRDGDYDLDATQAIPLVEAFLKERDARMEDEYERTVALHADLNRRAAAALGKPFAGKGSSWHDIPECITALRAKLKAAEDELARLRGENAKLHAQVRGSTAQLRSRLGIKAHGEGGERGEG
jgi:hypothetical protein